MLDSAQRLSVELMLAENADDRWAARTTGRAESRQNGKGDEVEVVEAWCLLQRGEWILHTAHEIKTAKSAHERMVSFLENSPDLRRKVRKIRYANGDESIYFTSGALVAYRTRTAGGGRGLDDISRIVIDEAQYVQFEQLASSMPILSANPNPQVNFIGSAGIADRSDFWWSLRVRALRAIAGEDEGEFSWLEHSAERVEINRDGRVISTSPNVEDRAAWYESNPTLGERIEEAFLAEELRVLGPEKFAREHLCVWDPYPGGEGGFLPVDQWTDLKIDPPSGLKSVCYGLSVSSDGDSAVFASAGRLSSGVVYVDVVDERRGTDWVIDRALDLSSRKKAAIRINPTAPEGAFKRSLVEAGVEVTEVTSRQYQQTCGEVLDTIKNGTIRHLGQSTLDRAVAAVQRRDVGKEGGWVWTDPASGADITALRAATLALSGVTARRSPRIHILEEATV